MFIEFYARMDNFKFLEKYVDKVSQYLVYVRYHKILGLF